MDATPRVMPVPPPIITDIILENENPTCTSPYDSDLQRRKVERQQKLTPRGSPSPSPALKERMDVVNAGTAPNGESSPIGAALLHRRAQRQARSGVPLRQTAFGLPLQ